MGAGWSPIPTSSDWGPYQLARWRPPAFTQYLHTIPSQYRTLHIITAALRKLSALHRLLASAIAASVAASALISFFSCLCKDIPAEAGPVLAGLRGNRFGRVTLTGV